ncbi:MAG: DNA polymerase II large subunit [Candidatus Diapherotrites archaeon]
MKDINEQINNYFEKISSKAMSQFQIATEARAKGLDISEEVECKPTLDLADRTENIIGPKGVAKRYRQLFEEFNHDRNKAIFVLFKEILEGKLGEISDIEKRLEQAVKTCLVLVTEGVVVAPLDGVPKVKISSNPDGSKYIDIYFAGPIRAAGGTATVFPLILGDYARNLLGLDKYKPTDDEVERYVEEINIYDEIITRQYKLKDDEIRKIVKGCPVCINGEPTEEREVLVWRDLQRIPSNRIRGGMCLVISEGIGLKAMKIMTLTKSLGLNWSWLEGIAKVSKSSLGQENELKPNYSFLSRIAAGRPIFSYPSEKGGFRLRYGRARNTCVMGKGLNPASMRILDDFIAVGTQIKVERPGKSAEMFPVDTIEGPIVKLQDGQVIKLKTEQEAIEVKDKIQEIIFLGDILVTIGDFRKTAHPLMPVGYCEEWWKLELEKAVQENKTNYISFIRDPFKVSEQEALEISRELGVPLHPEYIHYYNCLSIEEAKEIVKEIRKANYENKKLFLTNSKKVKEYLEKAGVPHKISEDKIEIAEKYSESFFITFGGKTQKELQENFNSTTEYLSSLSGLVIRDKCGTFIGTRMGRPEAAKPRQMAGNPMVIYPVGFAGGPTRSINKAAEKGKIEAELGYFLNSDTNNVEDQPFSLETGKKNLIVRKCKKCNKYSTREKCSYCNYETEAFNKREIDIKKTLLKSSEFLKIPVPELVKGVNGLISSEKLPEPLAKGILRARNNLHIFRDGTIRFELLNAPLTHFKPKEIGLSIEKAKDLGYFFDKEGKELVSEDQICELMPQDIIVNENAGNFFVKVTKFIDEELEKFYGLKRIYNYNTKEDLIGELFLGLAPHTSAAVLCRLIGYSKAKLNFAHPYFHLAKRRNADGDQDSLMLLMDALLNFSTKYLPSTRGGKMDAPLVFTIKINPTEIDDEVYEVETCKEYPLELYEKSLVFADPKLESIPTIGNKIGKQSQFYGFDYTHETSFFDAGPKNSTYVTLKSMEEKILSQAKLQSKIRAIDKKDALERVLISHFLPDIIGNARAFAKQELRCSKCNSKYRRIPLVGKCTKCGEKLILTIAEGSVKKYLAIAKRIVKEYNLSTYLEQRIILIEREIDSVFAKEEEKQKSILQFT